MHENFFSLKRLNKKSRFSFLVRDISTYALCTYYSESINCTSSLTTNTIATNGGNEIAYCPLISASKLHAKYIYVNWNVQIECHILGESVQFGCSHTSKPLIKYTSNTFLPKQNNL